MSDRGQDGEAVADTGSIETESARALAGAWSDLDWEEALDELDRIRKESEPTPPIDEL